MRYALARGVVGLPPASVQRDRLQRVGFDMLLQEDAPTRDSQKALTHLLARLRAADEVCLCSLEVLQLPTTDLILVLRRFQTAGNKLLLVDTLGVEDLAKSPASRLLDLLARNELSWPSRSAANERRRPSPKLTRYQVHYARELRRRGESLRAIGLLFQISPGELQDLLVGDRVGQPQTSDHRPGDGPPAAARVFLAEGDLANRNTLQRSQDRPANG